MPDPNKLKVLEGIDYRLTLGCGECQHGRFSPHSSFGQCAAEFVPEYVHAKHSEPRKLSVHRAGRCPGHEPNAKKMAQVEQSGFDRFLT